MPSFRSTTACLLGTLCGLVVLASTDKQVLFETRSRYNHILVLEDEDGLRSLLFSETGPVQSLRRRGETNVLELPYSRTMMVGLACVQEPKRMLVVGLGGGSIPSFLHARYPQTQIDCVEIDPAVIDVAKRFFGFREDARLRAYEADGRTFIEKSKEPYDLIFLDAYGDDAIPKHLTTREFLLAVRRALSPEGVVLGNIWSRASNPLHDAMLRTYQDVFEQLYLFQVPNRGNIIFVAIPRAGDLALDELAKKARALAPTRHLGFDLEELLRAGYRKPESSSEAVVLTDAP